MELHGVTGAPYKHPEVRKKVPVFLRQRIDLDGGRRVKRSWKDTSILEVKKGDTVANFGTVAERVEFINAPTINEEVVPGRLTWAVRLYNVMGDYQDWPGEQRVYAFTPDSAVE